MEDGGARAAGREFKVDYWSASLRQRLRDYEGKLLPALIHLSHYN
jgi:hypothetical protein